jgi:flagellar basal-body rod protein FlgB
MLKEKSVSSIFANIDPLHRSLDYHLSRQNVLVSNIAHVDTPGYVPKDLARVDGTEFSGQLGVALARTSAAHIASTEPSLPTGGRVIEDPSAMGSDGNRVSLDRESAKAAANQIRYDVVSALASAELAVLSYAASDAKGG